MCGSTLCCKVRNSFSSQLVAFFLDSLSHQEHINFCEESSWKQHWLPVHHPAFKALPAAKWLSKAHCDYIILCSAPSQLPTVWSSATHPIHPNSWGLSPLQSLISYLLHFSQSLELSRFSSDPHVSWHFAFDDLCCIDTWIHMLFLFPQLRPGPLWALGVLLYSCNALALGVMEGHTAQGSEHSRGSLFLVLPLPLCPSLCKRFHFHSHYWAICQMVSPPY